MRRKKRPAGKSRRYRARPATMPVPKPGEFVILAAKTDDGPYTVIHRGGITATELVAILSLYEHLVIRSDRVSLQVTSEALHGGSNND